MTEGSTQDTGMHQWTAPGTAPGAAPHAAPPTGPPAGPPAGSPPPAPPGLGVPRASSPPPYGQPPAPPEAPTFRSWKPGIIALRPQGFGDFLAVPFRAMRFNRAVVVGGPLAVSVTVALASSVTLWLLFTEPMWDTIGVYSQATSVGVRPETLALAGVTLVLTLLGDIVATGIVTPGVARAVLGEKMTLGQAWQELRPRLGALTLLWLLTSGAALVALAIASVPMILGIVANDAGVVILGYILVLAVAVVLGGAVAFISGLARPVVVLEKRGAVASIRRVLRLIKGRFWWTVLILVVAALLITVAASILQQVAGIGAVAVMFLAPEGGAIQLIGFLLVVAVGLAISTTATYAYLGALYPLLIIDLRIRHEGFDLTLAQAAEARRRA